MHLYNLTLQKAQAIPNAIFGSFSAPKAQEIVVSRGKILELLRPDDDTGKVQSVLATEVFGVLRDLRPFRLNGSSQDYVIAASDSGRIVILEYKADKNEWDKIHEETYGKSGCRRIVPGQYLAVDPKGRAVMIGAIEKQKLVYVLNRDTQNRLTISSPLEANKSNTIAFDITGVDVGFENPVFACIEADYDAKSDEVDRRPSKMLTYYELDLGLNHVTRKWAEPCDPGSYKLLTVPGDGDWPGGVIVCAENWLIWKNQGCNEVRAPIPRRFGIPDDKGVLIVATATHVQKGLFFFFVQSEYGDVYKVWLDWEEDGDESSVTELHVKYFDTLPVATSLCVLKTGFLFCASEFSNHYLFQFMGIGDDDDTATTSSKSEEFIYFQPRNLTNLALIDEMESLGPILDMKVADLAKEHTPQIYSLCGRGPRSSLRILRHGLAVTEMAVSELPGNPNAVWAVKKNATDEHHTYIVVSFVNATIVLSIGETVMEVSDSGILDSTPTLSVSTLGDNSLLQIHPNGLRHIRADGRINEWKTPGKKTIVQSAVNERQVVIGLSGGELVYFELDSSQNLMDVHRKEMKNDIACLAIGPIPEGRQRSTFMVVGSFDNTVRVLSLDPAQPMNQLTLQAIPNQPQSLCLVDMFGGSSENSTPSLYLYVGLQDGVMIRSVVDEADGRLTDTRKRFLGTRPVKLFKVSVYGQSAVLALSSRSWLSYTYQNRFHMTPLSYELLEHCSPFNSEQCPEGLVCISDNTLRIVMLEKLGELFNQTVVPLRYTPRKLLVHDESSNLVIIESDHNSYSYKVKKELLGAMKDDEASDDDEDMKAKKEEDEEKDEGPSEAFIGAPQAGMHKWASCIRVVNPVEGETLSLLELEDNEAAFSMCMVKFGAKAEDQKEDGLTEQYLAVGTIKDYEISPPKCNAAFIRLYKFINDGTQLQLVHKTPVSEPPLAMAAFQKRLLVGMGNFLRMYDLGKRKLLRKCENKNFPTAVQGIHVMGDRIYVADMCESFFLVKYNKNEKTLNIWADTFVPRYITSSEVVDYDTVAAGDKFGNVFIARLPPGVTEDIETDPSGGKSALLDPYNNALNQTPHKLVDICQYHVGEIVTSIQKVSLVTGGSEVLFYSTIMGGMGIFVPFSSREDLEFFSHLEMHMRQESPPLCGRDHLAFRSYYFPVKDTVDGDLCEQFSNLPWERQSAIAEELVRVPAEVTKKLEEVRNRVL